MLLDLVSFVQFKKRQKHQWKSVTFSKVAGSKSNTPPSVFFMFFKLYKWYQIAQSITYEKKNLFQWYIKQFKIFCSLLSVDANLILEF